MGMPMGHGDGKGTSALVEEAKNLSPLDQETHVDG